MAHEIVHVCLDGCGCIPPRVKTPWTDQEANPDGTYWPFSYQPKILYFLSNILPNTLLDTSYLSAPSAAESGGSLGFSRAYYWIARRETESKSNK